MGCGSSGSQNSTTTSTSQPPQQVLDAYTNLVNQAQQVSNQPLQQYQGSTVAGFTQDQLQAMQTVDNAQGMSQPYTNAATQIAGNATSNLAANQALNVNSQSYQVANTANQITSGNYQVANTGNLQNALQSYNNSTMQSYESPYTQQVINSTMANLNQQDALQQNALSSSAMGSGAYGGDRAGVSAAALAGQQDLANNSTIANLENSGFQNAQSEYNTVNNQNLQAATSTAANTLASEQSTASNALSANTAAASNELSANQSTAANALTANQDTAQNQLTASQDTAQNQLSAANEINNFGTTAQTNTLSAAAAQAAQGLTQQQLAQEQLNVPYEAFEQAQAYPYQATSWLGNIVEGIGSNSGGNSNSTTTTSKRGGRIEDNGFRRGEGDDVAFASGGTPGEGLPQVPMLNNPVIVPPDKGAVSLGHTLPTAQAAYPHYSQPTNPMQDAAAAAALGNAGYGLYNKIAGSPSADAGDLGDLRAPATSAGGDTLYGAQDAFNAGAGAGSTDAWAAAMNTPGMGLGTSAASDAAASSPSWLSQLGSLFEFSQRGGRINGFASGGPPVSSAPMQPNGASAWTQSAGDYLNGLFSPNRSFDQGGSVDDGFGSLVNEVTPATSALETGDTMQNGPGPPAPQRAPSGTGTSSSSGSNQDAQIMQGLMTAASIVAMCMRNGGRIPGFASGGTGGAAPAGLSFTTAANGVSLPRYGALSSPGGAPSSITPTSFTGLTGTTTTPVSDTYKGYTLQPLPSISNIGSSSTSTSTPLLYNAAGVQVDSDGTPIPGGTNSNPYI